MIGNIRNKRILVCVPRSKDGGLANYYNSLRELFSLDVTYFYRGKPNWPFSKGVFRETLRIIHDYVSFIIKVITCRYELIHINTFFGGKGLHRDLVFLVISKILHKKVIVFFRGWDFGYSSHFDRKLHGLLKLILFKADALITLSSREIAVLKEWHYPGKIYLETTTVDNQYVHDLTVRQVAEKYSGIHTINILFLARVIVEKGIYKTVQAFHLLRDKYPHLRLYIAGQGEELEYVKEFVREKSYEGVSFEGFVQGEEKKKLFMNAHVYVFPTWFAEGMPNSVLEAFAYGLPVITTTAGGLVDIFHEPENGFLVTMKSVDDLINKLEKLITDQILMKKIAVHNFHYAREKFVSTVVVKRLESIYSQVLNNDKKDDLD